uniref:Uncharacterized protein n=1 Tax=Arundo donax TaxID=35708 RepID=A0A0A8ZN48_ARUDO
MGARAAPPRSTTRWLQRPGREAGAHLPPPPTPAPLLRAIQLPKF